MGLAAACYWVRPGAGPAAAGAALCTHTDQGLLSASGASRDGSLRADHCFHCLQCFSAKEVNPSLLNVPQLSC